MILVVAAITLTASHAFARELGKSPERLARLGLASMRVASDADGMQVRGMAFGYPPTLPSAATATLPTLPAPNSRLGALPSGAQVPLFSGSPGQPGR